MEKAEGGWGWGGMKQQQRIQQWRQRPENNMPNPGSHFLLHRRLLWNSRSTSNVTGGRGEGETSLSLSRTYSPTPFPLCPTPLPAIWIEVKQGTATSKYAQQHRQWPAYSALAAVAASATSAKADQSEFSNLITQVSATSNVHCRAALCTCLVAAYVKNVRVTMDS